MAKKTLRFLFTLCIVWPVIWLWLGLRVKHRERLPQSGPAIIVANHNSHMDVFALLSLFSLRLQQRVHPVAAADYFLRNKWLAWFTLHILNIIPVVRNGGEADPLAGCEKALRDNKILILFPEGTRGEPGKLAALKPGIWHLVQRMPEVPVIPVWLSGTERVMAKGNRIPLPLFIDANVGEKVSWIADKHAYTESLLQHFLHLQSHLEGQHNHEHTPHA
ncbi:lysophospholipid acyltransferase family protein [Superficieibacter sp.]|uniref:lysophospholipid acyltransferase family protein n=1 Tax=Superficieibacter sp. TaxID=2303322 RepID=UPI0028A9AB7C|nr:lysophospholipid acyltransferase family protein [Superficieibacter sp.]